MMRQSPTTADSPDDAVARARAAQGRWADWSVGRRLGVIEGFIGLLAQRGEELAQSLTAANPTRWDPAQTLSSELIPLADAGRFLVRRARKVLRTKSLGRRFRPLWLTGVRAEIRRQPLGVVLVIGPGNYPLFIPGVQVLQALAAGNAAVIKPGRAGTHAAEALRDLLVEAGLEPGLLTVVDESAQAASACIEAGVDKVILTGSASTGRKVLGQCAQRLTPAVVELSGADAVFILPGADHRLAARAIGFGMRLNAGATCIGPRRIFVIDDGPASTLTTANDQAKSAGANQEAAAATPSKFEHELTAVFERIGPLPVSPDAAARARNLVDQALDAGARLAPHAPHNPHNPDWLHTPHAPHTPHTPHTDPRGPSETKGNFDQLTMKPTLVVDAPEDSALLETDVFAPLCTLVRAKSVDHALSLDRRCPFALGGSIFGPAREARALAPRLRAGSVCINDLIAPTADPRLPFGGRDHSGFGRTRGEEGLIEMTTAQSISHRRPRHDHPHHQPSTEADTALLSHLLQVSHGQGLGRRLRAVGPLVNAARRWRKARASAKARRLY